MVDEKINNNTNVLSEQIELKTPTSNENIDIVKDGEEVLAIIIRGSFNTPGRTFFTPNHFPFQLGMHIRGPEDYIPPHHHRPFPLLKDLPVQEFFLMYRGSIDIGFYNKQRELYARIVLKSGDMIIVNCPHDIKFLEANTKFLELKQGPYRGKEDEKAYFEPKSVRYI